MAHGQRITSSTSGIGKAGYPYAKKWKKFTTYHIPYTQNSANCIDDLSTRHETTLKKIEGNTS